MDLVAGLRMGIYEDQQIHTKTDQALLNDLLYHNRDIVRRMYCFSSKHITENANEEFCHHISQSKSLLNTDSVET